MGEEARDTSLAFLPSEWFVVFWRRAQSRVARWLPGEFKHVTACGYSDVTKTWIFVNPRMDRLIVEAIPDAMVELRLAEWTRDNVVVRVNALPLGSLPRFGLGIWCVPVIGHLVGLRRRGALLPGGLLRNLLPRAKSVTDWRSASDGDAEAGHDRS